MHTVEQQSHMPGCQADHSPQHNNNNNNNNNNTPIQIFGASWCPWTKKAVDDMEHLRKMGYNPDYVECSTNPDKCVGVQGYPQYKIGEQTVNGYRPASEIHNMATASATNNAHDETSAKAADTIDTDTSSDNRVKIYGAKWCGWTKKAVAEADQIREHYPLEIIYCDDEHTVDKVCDTLSGYPTYSMGGVMKSGYQSLDSIRSHMNK